MDLHAWITQQVDAVEALARAQPPMPWRYDSDEDQVLAADDIHVAETFALSNRQQRAIGAFITAHDPAAVLRRCEADRRILARHRLAAEAAAFPGACEGCGLDSWDLPNAESLNDCPELLDLAHAHGITDDILASLDRPQPPEPTPAQKRRLRESARLTVPLATADVPAALRGPNWKP